MAHLVKLEDYVSRYQYDMYRYPSQFSRLKRERWARLKREWEESYLVENPSVEHFVEKQKKTIRNAFSKLKTLYKRKNQTEDFYNDCNEHQYQFKYKSLPELKINFLRELFEFQLNWASSTLVEKSTLKKSYLRDETLKWFLQSLPDNYFVFYYPVVTYPKAAVQFDILVVGPTEIWCIVNLEGRENSIFQTYSERYWLELNGDDERKIINPLLSLNRMSTILNKILEVTEIRFKVKKAVLTQEGYIDVTSPWGRTTFLDQRNINEWQQKLKNNSTPIKSTQLRFCQKLLDLCQTTSEPRSDLEQDIDEEN
ncbi:hypothetical protein BKP37_13605 [Anaerobacillus alkalilacustris]|uniref:NERD domain-containing protein n=1 Tax=Anaerobacillus alkalilacustris TaxID=393763 RepID=A0A1S2LLB8_9BACI|nr:nuclease-related domain-containing protein [Anaerobacillus alkalilacustris]OIJ12467.1 hypothetical protein BKP37_13605 [Anaerobacillus alkalilacustris]